MPMDQSIWDQFSGSGSWFPSLDLTQTSLDLTQRVKAKPIHRFIE